MHNYYLCRVLNHTFWMCQVKMQLQMHELMKPLPVEENKLTVEPLLGKALWSEYCDAFKKKESEKLISRTQHARLLSKSPDVDKLHEYGF